MRKERDPYGLHFKYTGASQARRVYRDGEHGEPQKNLREAQSKAVLHTNSLPFACMGKSFAKRLNNPSMGGFFG